MPDFSKLTISAQPEQGPASKRSIILLLQQSFLDILYYMLPDN